MAKKKYKVEASETVFYERVVKADSAEEAREMFMNGEKSMEHKHIVDGSEFIIDEITEKEE
jgi:hypothetical protein